MNQLLSRSLRWSTLCGAFLGMAVAHAADPALPAAPAPAKGFLRIGAWNVENLGYNAVGRNAPKPEDQKKPDLLAEYILTSGVDVLAIEEIHDNDQKKDEDFGAAPWKNVILDQMLPILSKATGDDWRYELTDPHPDNERCQMTGVLWRTTKAELKGRWMVPVAAGLHPNSDESYWKRRPEAFNFAAIGQKADFILIPFHLKSNRGTVGTEMRPIEAKQLQASLQGLTDHFKGEKDIVLLGDTNILPKEKDVQAVWTGFKDLNAEEKITWSNPFSKYPPAPFDRIFVPKGQPEFANSVQKIHGPYPVAGQTEKQWFINHLKGRSDHMLVWCDIDVQADDD